MISFLFQVFELNYFSVYSNLSYLDEEGLDNISLPDDKDPSLSFFDESIEFERERLSYIPKKNNKLKFLTEKEKHLIQEKNYSEKKSRAVGANRKGTWRRPFRNGSTFRMVWGARVCTTPRRTGPW